MPKRTPDLPPKMLAAEIAAGRIKASLGMVQVDPADHASSNLPAFQPSAWKAPAWRTSGRCKYVCDDPMEQALAVAVSKYGFDLPKFDTWLNKQPRGNLRDVMVMHRHALWEAIAGDDDVAVRYRLREMDTRQALDRDGKRQAGVHQDRGSHMPRLDEWLRLQDLGRSNQGLFDSLASEGDSLCNMESDLYVDGLKIVECDGRGEHAISRAGFNKRVTAARKEKARQDVDGIQMPDKEAGRTSERLAKKAGVGVTTIKRAIHVREKGTDELNAAVAGMKDYEERKARERMAIGGSAEKKGSATRRTLVDDPGRVTEKLAEKAGVGARTVNRALKVRKQGTEEVATGRKRRK